MFKFSNIKTYQTLFLWEHEKNNSYPAPSLINILIINIQGVSKKTFFLGPPCIFVLGHSVAVIVVKNIVLFEKTKIRNWRFSY